MKVSDVIGRIRRPSGCHDEDRVLPHVAESGTCGRYMCGTQMDHESVLAWRRHGWTPVRNSATAASDGCKDVRQNEHVDQMGRSLAFRVHY